MLCNGNASFVPLRSPHAVQSVIANMSIGLNIAEIGTRKGDTVKCYKKYASSVLAIEVDKSYCKDLRNISNISVLCPVDAFNVPTKLDKDAITFWVGQHEDEKLIEFLFLQKSLKIISKSTRLWLFVDHQLREEISKYETIKKRWPGRIQQNINVAFDEYESCQKGMHKFKKHPSHYLNCRRAKGIFTILELV